MTDLTSRQIPAQEKQLPLATRWRRWTWPITLFALFTIILGAIVSTAWLKSLKSPSDWSFLLPRLAIGLGITMALTAGNVVIRWLRWHFLTRRIGARLVTRESALVYLVTLPAVVTPFFVGELLRVALLGRKYPLLIRPLSGIWLFERVSDAFVVSLMLSCITRHPEYVVIGAAAWVMVIVGLRIWLGNVSFPRLRILPVALTLTVTAWVLPCIGLWGLGGLLGQSPSLATATEVFGRSTLLGGLTGLPGGVGVTGSAMVTQLQAHDMDLAIAIWTTLVFRFGTVWFLVVVGCFGVWAYWGRLINVLYPSDGADHFDEIAAEYEDQIPLHVRDKLLGRKTELMQRHLRNERQVGSLRGLDIGCGQGWYVCEMSRLGFDMCGIDASSHQIEEARKIAASRAPSVRLIAQDATVLPFPDNSFDFAYAINVIHHVMPAERQMQALREIIRVLKPGGVFFLHEWNTVNPLFRFYSDYVFPLVRSIDEGIEIWIRPDRLPAVAGAKWATDIEYFTFLPDFTPRWLLKPLSPVEGILERSPLRVWSAHYLARLTKVDDASA